MKDVSNIDTSTSLFNGKFPLPFPICLAPIASQKMAHAEGECAAAKGSIWFNIFLKISNVYSISAAAELNTIMVVSTIATTKLEDVATAAPTGRRWFQLYVYKNRTITEALVKRVEKAGYEALVVTINIPVTGKRRPDVRNSFALPAHLR